MAALLQKHQTLTYVEYASALMFLRALPSWFLTGLLKNVPHPQLRERFEQCASS